MVTDGARLFEEAKGERGGGGGKGGEGGSSTSRGQLPELVVPRY